MNICLFSKDEIEKPLSIKDERGEHIIKILHKKEGDGFSAGIIGGMAGTALITKITADAIEYTFSPKSGGKPLHPLTMIIGFPRPIQLKRLLRDIAALGVCTVRLTGTELGEKSYLKSSLAEPGAAYKMLLDGTVQAASTHIPALFMHQTLKECLEKTEEVQEKNCPPEQKPLLLALDNVRPEETLVSALKKYNSEGAVTPADRNVIAAIGSERGWTDSERTLLEKHGFIRCGMGERIMRTETAATVSAAVISAECGWLQ